MTRGANNKDLKSVKRITEKIPLQNLFLRNPFAQVQEKSLIGILGYQSPKSFPTLNKIDEQAIKVYLLALQHLRRITTGRLYGLRSYHHECDHQYHEQPNE